MNNPSTCRPYTEFMLKEYWVIDVKNWGTLYGFGEEEDAESWRKHKAIWEESVATKRRATPEEIAKVKHWDNLAALL